MTQDSKIIDTLLDSLQGGNCDDVSTAAAWNRFEEQRLRSRKWSLPFAVPLRTWAVAGVCLAVLAVVIVSPARVWAQKMLSMLRVQKIEVIPVGFAGGGGATPDSGHLLARLISDNVVVTMDPGKPVRYASLNDAAAHAGFAVRTPDLGTPNSADLTGEAAFHMQVNVERLNNILSEAGRTDINIPQSADGATVAVHISRILHVSYGAVQLIETPSPVVSVPPGLNVPELAQAGLQLAGLSSTDAAELANRIDWSTTLVIPVPSSHAKLSTVTVDGVEGSLIQAERRDGRTDYAVTWTKDGILYGVHGFGDPATVLNSLASFN